MPYSLTPLGCDNGRNGEGSEIPANCIESYVLGHDASYCEV